MAGDRALSGPILGKWPALGSTPRRARLAHPVPFGFLGRYFADLRA
jgi:hypothetical protein